MQRFQYGDIKSEDVGRAYLRWDYTSAVDALLALGDGQSSRAGQVNQAKTAWLEARDAHTALKLIPYHLRSARQVNRGNAVCEI